MDRVKFTNENGQRNFLDLCIIRLSSPSLRGLLQFGFDVKYSTLKNYYSGDRLLPVDFFEDLLEATGISSGEVSFEVVDEAWGQKKGGIMSKRGKIKSENKI